MAPKLYLERLSPPCRAIQMCARAIGLDLEEIEVSILKGDHLKPEFVKLNPLHTVPVLDDDGLVLCDSHAILGYLVAKYAKDKSLYPEDVKKRALIDQKLYFDAAILFTRHLRAAVPIYTGVEKIVAEANAQSVREAFGFLEIFLQNSKYVAGDTLSIADFSVINTVTNASALVPFEEESFPNIAEWRNRLKTLPYYDINQVNGEAFKKMIKSMVAE